MAETGRFGARPRALAGFTTWGVFWLILALLGAGLFFRDGIAALLAAWQTPEYSHGPLIPILSGFLFLRQLKDYPERPGPIPHRWPGLVLLALSIVVATAGQVLQIPHLVAYALIFWAGAMLLISFGWETGRHFWPPVLHLVFMLPLPGTLYYGLSVYLQGISSELGASFLRTLAVPVYLEGNIIDLGVMKLHVAEACSGLRYLFPIMSFSYVFAVLYKGPMWHKAVLLLSAAPITVLMNSVRIALAGWIVNHWGLAYVEGFSHFFEGWVIFIACVLILFALAQLMLMLRPDRIGLIDALDLDTTGLGQQLARLRLVQPSGALISAALVTLALAGAFLSLPDRERVYVDRTPFLLFPDQLGDWHAGPRRSFDADLERTLGADDYHSVMLTRPGAGEGVDLYLGWYRDSSDNAVHSPEVCLPGRGWEIASLQQERAEGLTAGGAPVTPFDYNRAIIQRGETRMLVYYWFEQNGVRTASEFTAKVELLKGKFLKGREDSALVRLITAIDPADGGVPAAETRLDDVLGEVLGPMPDFVPPT
ncbi:MAG: VPLPA-CTERM-specific exosortase XrtD [Rhodobacteraceae bacterium]|nr:VPLPA-CTERM-specific exosortase XrtD [Paracoccaceae bacterium]MAY47677.1 VPLPA-CTERM-specific exosortase XrtD [Paracoccaceae bacterium]